MPPCESSVGRLSAFPKGRLRAYVQKIPERVQKRIRLQMGGDPTGVVFLGKSLEALFLPTHGAFTRMMAEVSAKNN